MSTITSSNVGSNYLQTFLEKNVLENFEPNLRFYSMGSKPLMENGFGSVTWALPTQLTATSSTAALTEGSSPSSMSFGYSVISATPVQYGLFVEVSDRLLKMAPTQILENAGTELAHNMGRIIDQVIQTEVMGGSHVVYSGSVANRAALWATNTIVADDIRKAQVKLRSLNAPDFDGLYVGVLHPFVAGDLRAGTNGAYVEFSKYTTPEKLFNGELGAIYGVRLVESANVQTFASTVTVYPTLVVGQGAYGVTEWESLEGIYKPLGFGQDPLNQRATVGVKVDFAVKRLQDNALVRIESAATSL